MTKNEETNMLEIFFSNFVDKKFAIYLFLVFVKNFQATEDASNPAVRTFSTSIHEMSSLFSFLWVIIACLDLDPDSQSDANPEAYLNPDPNTEHWHLKT
jgi:hypothetical protein